MNKKLIIGFIALTMFVGSASAFAIPFVDSGQQTSPPNTIEECRDRSDCQIADNQTEITVESVKVDDGGIFSMFSTLIGYKDANTYDEEVTEGEEVTVETDVKITWSSGSSGEWLIIPNSFYPTIENRQDEDQLGIGDQNAKDIQVYYDDYTNIDYDISTEDWYSSYPPSHNGWLSNLNLALGNQIENVGSVAFNVLPDKDGDGVIYPDDECPDVEGDEDTAGCPDQDNDDTRDSQDQCPDESGDTPSGCPDSDDDGKLDSPHGADLCPNTKGPSNPNGCPTVYYQQVNSCISDNLYDVDDSKTTYDSRTSCQSNLVDNGGNQSDDDNDCENVNGTNTTSGENCGNDEEGEGSSILAAGIIALVVSAFIAVSFL